MSFTLFLFINIYLSSCFLHCACLCKMLFISVPLHTWTSSWSQVDILKDFCMFCFTNWQDYVTISSSSSSSPTSPWSWSPWSWSSWSSRWSSSWSSLALAWIACEPPKGNCTLEITVAVSHQCFSHHRHHHRHHHCYYNRHHHCHQHCHHYCHHHCHHHLHCHHHHYCRHP